MDAMLDLTANPAPAPSCGANPTRRSLITAAAAAGLILAGCATSGRGDYQSGPLAGITPTDFASYDPAHIAAGIDIDSRVPASLNRGIELIVAVVPVDHDVWEPIGARLPMRPLMLLGEKPDVAAGKPLLAWGESPPGGRLRTAYVLTDEGRDEMRTLQGRFKTLMAKHPPGSPQGGALRIRVDMYRMLPANVATYADSQLQSWLQLILAKGPFLIWEGRLGDIR
ncbi:MAG: hypothetical protein R3E83_05105 [Burkholderiaceae bacterium]